MTADEIAKRLNIARKTIFNWKKNRKELYEIILKGLESENIDVNNTLSKDVKELVILIEKLTKKEKEMYISEIKARILRRELEEK